MNNTNGFVTQTKAFFNPEYITDRAIARFHDLVYSYYRKRGRNLPWRRTKVPYHILVSEIMLQQTQVDRVLKKYTSFLEAFPGIHELSHAPLDQVLREWQGLGYNRRCLYLKKSADEMINRFGSRVPDSYEDLLSLPGIGHATASSILAFVFDVPTVFIETNIRTLFIHYFFSGRDNIHDSDIYPLVERTLDKQSPRTWYYAMMDYGAELKRRIGSMNSRSIHYTKQSPFEGSKRQVRGMILRVLLEKPGLSKREIAVKTGKDTRLVKEVIASLAQEGFIQKGNNGYSIVNIENNFPDTALSIPEYLEKL